MKQTGFVLSVDDPIVCTMAKTIKRVKRFIKKNRETIIFLFAVSQLGLSLGLLIGIMFFWE